MNRAGEADGSKDRSPGAGSQAFLGRCGALQTVDGGAAGFVFLTSAEAWQITGAALNVGGGVVLD